MFWRRRLYAPLRCCIAAALLTSTFLGGCSIHPLTEDVTSLNTLAVVYKIRCEARHAIKEQLVYLLAHDDVADAKIQKEWSNKVDQDFYEWGNVPLEKFSKKTRMLIDRYDGALMYFDFTFTINEENNIGTEINLLSALTKGSNALNIKASSNRKRQNIRNFRVQDTFERLLDARLQCDTRSRLPDYVYPVTGEIGLSEVVDTFLQLNETGVLHAGAEKDRLFADTLTFTTIVSGSATPKIVLSPIGKALSLADANITATAIRSDTHQVLIGLSLPTDEIVLAKRKVSSRPFARSDIVTKVIRQPKTEQSIELNQFMDFQIQRNLILNATDARPLAISLF